MREMTDAKITKKARNALTAREKDTFFGSNHTDPVELRRCLEEAHHRILDAEEVIGFLLDRHDSKEGISQKDFDLASAFIIDSERFHDNWSRTPQAGGKAPYPAKNGESA